MAKAPPIDNSYVAPGATPFDVEDILADFRATLTRVEERMQKDHSSLLGLIRSLVERVGKLEATGEKVIRRGTQAGHIDDLPKLPGF